MPTWKPLLKKDDWGHFGCLFECGAQKKPGILIGPCMHCGLSWHPSCIAKRCKLNEEPTYKDTDCIVHVGGYEVHITQWKCPICTVAFEAGGANMAVMACTQFNQTGKLPTSQSGVGSKRNRAKVSDGAAAFKYVCPLYDPEDLEACPGIGLQKNKPSAWLEHNQTYHGADKYPHVCQEPDCFKTMKNDNMWGRHLRNDHNYDKSTTVKNGKITSKV